MIQRTGQQKSNSNWVEPGRPNWGMRTRTPAHSRAFRPPTKSRRDSIISGDKRAGNGFVLPVRTLGEQTIPSVSAPPGNSGEFQAHAVFPNASKKPKGFSMLRRTPANPRAFLLVKFLPPLFSKSGPPEAVTPRPAVPRTPSSGRTFPRCRSEASSARGRGSGCVRGT